MIDLHSHTNESDGSFTPQQLVSEAVAKRLEALAITDHDTFSGFELAKPYAEAAGLDLVRGVEINTRAAVPGFASPRNVHVLGYFLIKDPDAGFQAWLNVHLSARRTRNQHLVERLNELGVAISLPEVETLGRTLTGRPHFARVLMQKGYAKNYEEAFRNYLGEGSPGFVERQSPDPAAAIAAIRSGGGLPVLAHPGRIHIINRAQEERFIRELRDAGLVGIEAIHSDHAAEDRERYRALADNLGLLISGGSDFHGEPKPNVVLGSGINGNVSVARSVLDDLRAAAGRL